MEVRDISTLQPWAQNPRSIKGDNYQKLKKQLMLGQHSTLLITADGTVLGGNMRLKAMKEIHEEYPTLYDKVKCIVVDFVHSEADDGFFAVVDGEEVKHKSYKTKEDGMMEYSLSHNDRAGYYDITLMANVMPNFNIEWNDFSVDFVPPVPIEDAIKKELDKEEQKNYFVIVECANEIEQGELYNKFAIDGLKVKKK